MPSPSTDNTDDKISIFGRVTVVKFTFRYLPVSSMATSMNGIVKPNRNRQWVWSMMMPDSVGPSAGATVNIMVITPMAVPRFCGG